MAHEHYKREEYVYMDAHIRMSQKAMANFLYASIMTRASLPTSFGVGIYEYDRHQNSFNNVDIKVHLHPSYIPKFEDLSGTKLRKPVSITINSNE